jgi:predicted nucleic acid-binding protein
MNEILLDTNVLIDYLRNIPQAVKYLEELTKSISISAMAIAELHAGARNNNERLWLREFTSVLNVIPANAAICEMGGDLRSQYGPSHGLDLIDGILAATAIIKRLPLVTLNKKHFPMIEDQNMIIPYRERG